MKKKLIALMCIVVEKMARILPLRNTLYFCSYHGQYCDSPKYISIRLHKEYPSMDIIWEISSKCHERLPEYVNKVTPFSIKSAYLRSRSKVVIDNYLGWSYGYQQKKGLKYYLLSHIKHSEQINICTWHGTPIKKIGLDEPKNMNKSITYFYSTANFLLAGNQFVYDLFSRQTKKALQIEMFGTPRNDILFCNDFSLKNELKKKLKLPLDKKIILFAPTFRNTPEFCGIAQIKMLNIEELLSRLKEKFAGEWIFVWRVHDSVLEIMENQQIDSSFVVSGNFGDDMAEYLCCSDILLTDYSSAMFDFIICKRPCFLFCPDVEDYASIERGFYFKIDDLPFPMAREGNELCNLITAFDEEQYLDGIEKLSNTIGLMEKGNATETVVEYLKNKM